MNPQTRKYNAFDSLQTPSRFYDVVGTGAAFDNDPDEVGTLTTQIAVTQLPSGGFTWEGDSYPYGSRDENGLEVAPEHSYTHGFTREELTGLRDMLTELLGRTDR